jgi:hypothetical protein
MTIQIGGHRGVLMRVFVLILTAAIVGTATPRSASAAPAACDATCTVIKRVVADRANAFASLKGAPIENVTSAWNATVTVPDLSCSVSDQKFDCDGFFLKAKGEKKLASVLAAFRRAEPNWKWYGAKGADGHSVYGGPAKGSFIASIQSLAPPPGAEANKDQYMFTLIVNVAAQPTTQPLKPVRP